MRMKDMYNCLLLTMTLELLFLLPASPVSFIGDEVEQCVMSVLAKRSYLTIPEGGTLSLSCDVLHCGEAGWTAGWWMMAEKELLPLRSSLRHNMSNFTLSTNASRLLMVIINANQSDFGAYQCQIVSFKGHISVGHMTYVNVTAAAPTPSSVRTLYSRLVVYGSSCLVIAFILVLACSTRSKVTSQPTQQLPPTSPHSRGTKIYHPSNSKPKPQIELVYAALSKDTLCEQKRTPEREAAQTTVYSSLRFS
ncbi:hypothetical protein UPYG_G00194860 [Umbra pygmaea]|uniref:Ig-like domain-containing protein n=1 Tax=Umbra pygmaea TaxID=75934 RepID=A0ABD0X152_UMBPY